MQEDGVAVRFVTKLAEPLRVPESVITIPMTLNRQDLSGIVNHLLGKTGTSSAESHLSEFATNGILTDENMNAFDFLINDKFLRSSLSRFMDTNGILKENTLDIEYIVALTVPDEEGQSVDVKEWISDIAVSVDKKQVVLGCCDGTLRVYSSSNWKLLRQSASMGQSVKNVQYGDDSTIYAAYMDGMVRHFDADGQVAAEYGGSNSALSCLQIDLEKQHIAAGNTTGQVLIWGSNNDGIDAGEGNDSEEEEGEKRKKRHRLNQELTPVLLSHGLCVVNAICWVLDGQQLVSCGSDGMVCLWDPATLTKICSLSAPAPFTALQRRTSQALVAATTEGQCLLLSIAKASSTDISPMTIKASPMKRLQGGAWMTDLALPVTTSATQRIATISRDGKIRIWDDRCDRPLNVISAHEGVGLCCSFLDESTLLSGGQDGILHVTPLRSL